MNLYFYEFYNCVIRVVFCLIFMSCEAFASEPSFDCSQAYAADELAICNNDELAELDVRISDWFSYVASAYDLETAKTISLPYLKRRSSCGANNRCIKAIQTREIYAFSNLERALKYQKQHQIYDSSIRHEDDQKTTQEAFDKLDTNNAHDEDLNTRTKTPSFNCDNVKRLDEITICKDQKLSELDLNLHEQFRLNQKELDKKEGNNTKKLFLKKRRACKADATCIGNIYNEALAKYKNLYEADTATKANFNEELDRNETNVNSNNNPINNSTSSGDNDHETAIEFMIFISSVFCWMCMSYVDNNSDKCPSCGKANWHSNAESFEILDRKMRLGTFDIPTQHNGITHHHFRSFVYYDDVIRYNFSCKNCGNTWSVVRKKRG